MFNSFGAYPNPNSYEAVLKRMTERLQQNGVDEKILTLLKKAIELELEENTIILSRPDRNRLFREVSKTLMNNVLSKLDRKE